MAVGCMRIFVLPYKTETEWRNCEVSKNSNSNKNEKKNVYNWYHWTGTHTQRTDTNTSALHFEFWNTVACYSVHMCAGVRWARAHASMYRCGGWMGGVGWMSTAIAKNTECMHISIDRFVINLFERLTRIYFWQTNFYLCRQSRKALLFAKKKEKEIENIEKQQHQQLPNLLLLPPSQPKSKKK